MGFIKKETSVRRDFDIHGHLRDNFPSLTRFTDVHINVVADAMGELGIQQLVDGEFAPVFPDRVLVLRGIGVDRPAIGAPTRQTPNS